MKRRKLLNLMGVGAAAALACPPNIVAALNKQWLIPVRHSTCGEVAFYFRKRYSKGDELKATNVILLDGSQPHKYDKPTCNFCGEAMWLGDADCIQGKHQWV